MIIPKHFVLDLDGVFTDGSFHYSKSGKAYKVFGPDDHDAILQISKIISVQVVTADTTGFDISRKRIESDMGLSLTLVPARSRAIELSKMLDLSSCIYMGDGIFDSLVFKEVFYSIAPANSLYQTRVSASFVTQSRGGDRAVAEACLHIAQKFFNLDLINS